MKDLMGRFVAALFSLLLVLGMMPALNVDAATEEDIDVLSVKYNAKMAFDCQRLPAVPKKGNSQYITGLENPYDCADKDGEQKSLGDTYLKVEPLGVYKDQPDDVKYNLLNGGTQKIALLKDVDAQDLDNVPIYKLVQYNSDGTKAGDFSDPGCLYILDLDTASFLFCGCGHNTDKSYGYFLHGVEITDPAHYNNTFPEDKVEGLVINKKEVHPEATVVTAPVPKTGLVENGKPQELITAGSAEDGTMYYAVSTDPSAAPADGWSPSIPAGTKPGTYYVWYKVVGDATHADTDPAGPLTVKIAAVQYTVTYELNGGRLDGQTGTVSGKIDKGTVIILPAPTRDGYTFDYWEGGSRYYAGDRYTVNSDLTLKAVWKTADKGGGAVSGDSGKSSSNKKGVNTGDGNGLVFWVVLMSAALAGTAGMAYVVIGKR